MLQVKSTWLAGYLRQRKFSLVKSPCDSDNYILWTVSCRYYQLATSSNLYNTPLRTWFAISQDDEIHRFRGFPGGFVGLRVVHVSSE